MGIRGFINRAGKKCMESYRENQTSQKFERRIREHLEKTTDTKIPKLTAAQKRDAEMYWKSHGITLSSTDWHRFYYAKTGVEDPRFVPDDVFHRIIRPKLNDKRLAAAWSDKAYTDWVVRGVKTVRSVVRCVEGRLLNEQFELIDEKRANYIMNEYEALVLKPTMFTDTGKNVVLAHAPFAIDEIIAQYGRFFVAQLPLKQHPDMALLNESSVNTVRIDTVLLEHEAHVLSGFVKVGRPGDFTDNGGGEKDRVFIGIVNERFQNYALDHDCNKFRIIPSGYDYAGKRVPFFEEMCKTVEKAHTAIAHFGMAFWDVSVDCNGEPTIVEMNLRYPDSYIPQVASGPFFGDYTEDVLKFVRNI